ncbi:methyltransferase family protein [Microvirga roseola]|uniref:methyltransferase family protein n=1 Tax=Microvirga roseola TaxID=2883126 RepID=UPI001E3F3EB6|nr:isoprenylcysteine carboxylmethyltransferase family protein [Microvirga roseola]
MPSPWFPVLILLIVSIAFAVLTRRAAQRIGGSPNRFGADDTAHDFVGRVYRIGGGVLSLFLIVRAVWPGETDMAAGLIPVLVHPAVAWFGLVTMVMGSAVILAAQVGIGASWRIGLDQERTGLVTTGLFAWSRNPTFLGMVAVVLGALLVVPTAVTAVALAAAWIAFSVQIRMEEEHLGRMHGAAYDRYHVMVPRWIGLRRSSGTAPAIDGNAVDRG